jgi:hypothetical protein
MLNVGYITLPSKTNYGSLDLMAYNIILLRNVGIIPNKGTDPSSWRWKLNRFCHSLLFMIYIPALILQAVSLYSYWGNVKIIVESIGTMSGLSACYFPALYMIINWETFLTMMHKLENNSIFSSEMIRENDKQMTTIRMSKRSAIVLAWITIASITAIGVSFDTIPLMRDILSHAKSENPQNVDRTSEVFQYLVFVMWLPGDFSEDHWYWYVYTIQAFVVVVACAYLTAVLPFLLTVIIYTQTQFRLVTSSLKEIDDKYQVEVNDMELPKMGTDSDFGNSEQTASIDVAHSMGGNETQASSSTKFSKGADVFPLSEGCKVSTASHVTSEESDVASSYLVECIRLHQAVIE